MENVRKTNGVGGIYLSRGGDDLVLKVKIRTSKVVYKRSTTKLCLIKRELDQNGTV